DAPQPRFALAQRPFDLFYLGDITLYSPAADDGPIFHDAGLVVQKVFCIPIPIDFMSFNISHAVTGALEGAKLGDILRFGPDKQIADPRPQNLIRAVVTVHPRHRVVAFGQVSEFEEHLDLVIFGQRDRDRMFEFESPYRLGTLRDEGAVTLIALSQVSYRPRAFHGLPAPVGYFPYKFDFPI